MAGDKGGVTMFSAHTGLMIAAAGLGINVVDFLTKKAPVDNSGVSPGGIFYGPGGFLATMPKAGLYLIVIGGALYFFKR